MEMQAALPWTPNLFSQFEELHGYSITKYLPLLFHATNAWNGYIPPYNITYTLGEYRTDGGPYLQDYKTALSQGYVDYIEHFDSWASFREFQYSNQPGYNLPLDMVSLFVPFPSTVTLLDPPVCVRNPDWGQYLTLNRRKPSRTCKFQN